MMKAMMIGCENSDMDKAMKKMAKLKMPMKGQTMGMSGKGGEMKGMAKQSKGMGH